MSDEPRRLFEDPDAPELMRDDLGAAREASDVGYDATAGLARLSAAIGGAPPPPPTGAEGAGAAGAAGGTKAALIYGALAAIAIGGGVFVAKSGREAPRTPPAAVVLPSAAPSPQRSAAPKEDTPTLSLSALPLEKEAPSSAPLPAPSASAPLSAEERLRAEMKDLARVRAALGSNPAEALALANAGHAAHKGGVFYQERETLAISALVKLGRTGEAKSRGQAFLKAFPKGPYAERVKKEAGL